MRRLAEVDDVGLARGRLDHFNLARLVECQHVGQRNRLSANELPAFSHPIQRHGIGRLPLQGRQFFCRRQPLAHRDRRPLCHHRLGHRRRRPSQKLLDNLRQEVSHKGFSDGNQAIAESEEHEVDLSRSPVLLIQLDLYSETDGGAFGG